MRLFVSYSRHDAPTVRLIVSALEAEGHDVWIDTDDIRGSERWRTSVATAIRESDVVLLVVTPASMASSSVEREISVAAEGSLRIVPVVIEAAPISVGLTYDLAGVQRVSFVGRPFDDGMADLNAALIEPTGANAAMPVASASSDAPRRPSRKALYGMAAVVVLAAAVLVVRQLGADDDGAGTDVSADSPDTPTADDVAATVTLVAAGDAGGAVSDGSTASAAAIAATFDTTVWFAGFSLEVTEASYDEATGELTVDVLFTNDQRTTADPLNLLIESTPLVVDGTRYRLDCTNCTRLPPSSATRTTLSALVSGPVDLAVASLEFGTPDQHQAVVPLDGSPGTSQFPTSAPIEGTLVDGLTTFTAETVEIVPAGCSGLASDMAYTPLAADEMSIVVTGSAVTTERFGVNMGQALISPPGEEPLASNSLNGNMYALAPGVPQEDIPACFTVAAPVGGDYSFTVAHSGATDFPDPIVITL